MIVGYHDNQYDHHDNQYDHHDNQYDQHDNQQILTNELGSATHLVALPNHLLPALRIIIISGW